MTTEKDDYTKVPYIPSTLSDWFKTPNSLYFNLDSNKTLEDLASTPAAKNIYIDVPPIYTYKSPFDTLNVGKTPDISLLYGVTPTLDEQKLSNIHEPMAEHQKQINELKLAVYELQLNDEHKDIKIQQLTEKLEKKKRKSKTTKRKSKSSERVKLNKRITKIEKTVSTYKQDLRFMKDMHKEEAKDIDREYGYEN